MAGRRWRLYEIICSALDRIRKIEMASLRIVYFLTRISLIPQLPTDTTYCVHQNQRYGNNAFPEMQYQIPKSLKTKIRRDVIFTRRIFGGHHVHFCGLF
jgi:hypothetical protein